MKRIFAVILLVLLLCSCVPAKEQVTIDNDAKKTVSTVSVISEEEALEVLKDFHEMGDDYIQKSACVISHWNAASKNIQPLINWINCYREGVPARVEILYFGWTLPYICVFECDGSEQYTITEYSEYDGKRVYTSCMVTERVTDYTFGADIQQKGWPMTIKKEGVPDNRPTKDRYNLEITRYINAHPSKNEVTIYAYDSKLKDYSLLKAESSWSGHISGYVSQIENWVGRPLFYQLGVDRERGIVYINITQQLNTRNFTLETERAILYSLAKTIMENEPDYIGVCFETEWDGQVVSYDGGVHYGENEICMPPDAPPLGALSLKDAERKVKEHIALVEKKYDPQTELDTDKMVVKLSAAKYVDGVLCYVYDYYGYEQDASDGAYLGVYAIDVETGKVCYMVSMVDGTYILERDENEKRILPRVGK